MRNSADGLVQFRVKRLPLGLNGPHTMFGQCIRKGFEREGYSLAQPCFCFISRRICQGTFQVVGYRQHVPQ